MQDCLMRLNRNERRALLRSEAVARKSAQWGPWEMLTFPRGSAGTQWAADFTTVHRNKAFSVLDRTLPGGVRHLAISSLSQERPTWWEAQRIKNEIAGHEATAVEVYPPQHDVVDGADMYHMWIMTEPLPFTLASDSTGKP